MVLKSYRNVGLAAVLAVAAVAWSADAQQAGIGAYPAAAGARELITYFLPVEGKATTLALVDPASRHIAVYHVSRETGEIQLKSIRDIAGDLQLDYFNCGGPLPEEIRNGLKRVQP
jgi:hypothetical protein